jgi:hypothetical protein
LVRCTAAAGKRYAITAGDAYGAFGPSCNLGPNNLAQELVASIEVQAAQASHLQGLSPCWPDAVAC